jgi:hypothetical protein
VIIVKDGVYGEIILRNVIGIFQIIIELIKISHNITIKVYEKGDLEKLLNYEYLNVNIESHEINLDGCNIFYSSEILYRITGDMKYDYTKAVEYLCNILVSNYILNFKIESDL